MEIQAVLLDVNGTLFDAAAAAEGVFHELGLNDPNMFSLWFSEVLRDAFAAQLAGVFVPFQDFAGYHLSRRMSRDVNSPTKLPICCPEEAGARLLEVWTAAEPFPDVGPGLNELSLAGIKIAALTNGSRKIAQAVLSKAYIPGNEAAIFEIAEAVAWKPSKDAYSFAANALALQPSQILLVASHPWDCHGALQAGLKAAYVQRDQSEPYPSFLDQPQFTVKDFGELASTLLK